jgi:hypothetical protein
MASLALQGIPTGAQPWSVSISSGVLLTVAGATTEASYNTAQSDIMPLREIDYVSWNVADVPTAFRRHLTAWKADARAAASSKLSVMVLNQHYQRIIGMGLPVVPHILAELEVRPDHLDRALEAITGENPVPAEAAGKLRQIAQAWVSWGRERRLI